MKNTIKVLFVLVSTTLATYGFAQSTSQAPKLHDLDSVFNHILEDYKIAGFSVAVVHKDSLVYSKGFGFRDLENQLPATPNTLYAIGSSTKAFTAALVGKLLDNVQALDDKIGEHLPALQFQDGREAQVTIRDLMTHRTGLSRYDHSWYIFNTDSRDSLIRRVKYMEPTVELREKWLYNNFMYLAQGMIAERITGKTWEESVQEHFLNPLSMKRTNFDVNDMAKDPDAAKGYAVDQEEKIKQLPYYELRGIGPAGSINSSVVEIAQWLKVWLAEGKYEGKVIIPSAYIKEASSSQMVIESGLPNKHPDVHLNNYGLGWMISSYRGHYQVEHGGNIDGFTASVGFFPTDKLGIVVLSNQNQSAVPTIVRNLIADRWFNLPPIPWSERGKKAKDKDEEKNKQADLARVSGTQPSHPKADYTGIYSHPAYGTLQVEEDKDALTAILGNKRVGLTHYHYDVFEMKDIDEQGKVDTTAGGLKINFRTGQDGKIESAAITLDLPSGDPVEFKRELVAKVLLEKQIASYKGKYHIEGMDILVTAKDGVLYVDVPGQTNYETIAQGDHNFNMKGLRGYSIRFEFDGNTNKASSLYFIQPNGTFKAQRMDKEE